MGLFIYNIFCVPATTLVFCQFSLFCSFSTHCTHCYFVTFCYSTHYIILAVSFLVLLLKNANFNRCFIILHSVFAHFLKKSVFLFYSVSTHYNALTFFKKLFCSLFEKRLYLCSK